MDDIDAQNLDFGESTGGIQDGNIDAAFITAGTPTGAVEELQASADVSIVPVEKDKADKLIEENPYYAEDRMEEGKEYIEEDIDTEEECIYDIEEDVDTVAVLAMIVVTDDIPEDTVYDITKAIYENTDDIAHDKADAISKDSALDGLGDLELHPGAEKYYEEE